MTSAYTSALPPNFTESQRRVLAESHAELCENVCAAMLEPAPDARVVAHYTRETAKEIEASLQAAAAARSGYCDVRLALGMEEALQQQVALFIDKSALLGELERQTYERALVAQGVAIGLLRGGLCAPRVLRDVASLQTFFFRSLRQMPGLRVMCALRSAADARRPRCAERLARHRAVPRDRFEALLRAADVLEECAFKLVPQQYLALLRHAYYFQEQPQRQMAPH